MVLRKWLAVNAGIAMMVMLWIAPVSAGRMVIRGVITNWHRVKDKVSEKAYFQLVKVQKKMKGSTNREGLMALDSNLPQIPVRSWGRFMADITKVPPGEYLIALQRGLSSTPILVKDGKPLIIKIPGDFPLNVGRVELEISFPGQGR